MKDNNIIPEQRINLINNITTIDKILSDYYQKISNFKNANEALKNNSSIDNNCIKSPKKNKKNKTLKVNANLKEKVSSITEDEENEEISEDNYDNDDFFKNKKSPDKIQNKSKNKNKILEELELKENEKNEIFINNHYIPIIRYIHKIKTKTKYIYKSKSKNFIFIIVKLKINV
jgi:hypothetical protein